MTVDSRQFRHSLGAQSFCLKHGAIQDSSSNAPDVIVTRPSKASWGKWNKLRAVSLFLQIKWGECTRARTAKPRDAKNEGGSPKRKKSYSLFSCRLAPSITRVVIYVSRAFCSMDQEKRETAVVSSKELMNRIKFKPIWAFHSLLLPFLFHIQKPLIIHKEKTKKVNV